jgi:hypothetical protein
MRLSGCMFDDSKLSVQDTIQSTRADGTPSSDNKHTTLRPFVASRPCAFFITCTGLQSSSGPAILMIRALIQAFTGAYGFSVSIFPSLP